MFDTYLKKGDVIYLKSGTLVAVPGIRSVITDDKISPFCPFITTAYVKVGKENKSRTDVSRERSRLRKIIKQAFADDFLPLNESILDRFLAHQVKDAPELSLYIHPTRYVVTDVVIEGKRRTVHCKEAYNEGGHTIYFIQGPAEVRGQLVHNWISRIE